MVNYIYILINWWQNSMTDFIGILIKIFKEFFFIEEKIWEFEGWVDYLEK
jgi:hypothetical protein